MKIPLQGKDIFDLNFSGGLHREGKTKDGKDVFLWTDVEIISDGQDLEISDDTLPHKKQIIQNLVGQAATPGEFDRMRGKLRPIISDLIDADILQMDAADLRKLLFLLLWQQKALRPIEEQDGSLSLRLKDPREWMRRYTDE